MVLDSIGMLGPLFSLDICIGSRHSGVQIGYCLHDGSGVLRQHHVVMKLLMTNTLVMQHSIVVGIITSYIPDDQRVPYIYHGESSHSWTLS